MNILNKPHNSFDIVLNLQPLEYGGFFITQKKGSFFMQKNLSGALIFALLIGVPVYARDFEECFDGSVGQNEGFLFNDGYQDRCCLTDGSVCTDVGMFSCAGFFNMPSGVWQGFVSPEGISQYGDTWCYIDIPAGKSLSDTYDLFDEGRSYDDIFVNCDAGNYCPGMRISYSDVKGEYWGSTSVGAVACPDALRFYVNNSLNKYASVDSGHILSIDGATDISDCYVRSGTYYDSTGTYEILGSCSYQE